MLLLPAGAATSRASTSVIRRITSSCFGQAKTWRNFVAKDASLTRSEVHRFRGGYFGLPFRWGCRRGVRTSASGSSFGTGASVDVRVATYNVLSSSLCEPGYYVSCKPEDLDPEVRLPRVYEKLEQEIKQDAVICLQEVSSDWAGELHTFFQQRGYHFVLSLYGGSRNGYMGVGLAFPSDKFEAEKIDVKRLSDAFELPRPPRPGFRKRLGNFLSSVAQAMGIWKEGRPQRDEWQDSQRRSNTMVFGRLRDRETGIAFGVATYHMPCAFYAPKVMTLHTAMASTRAARLSSGLPVILAGDFNFMPGSETYRLVTEGVLPEDPKGAFTPVPPHSGKTALSPTIPFWEAIPLKLKSAYNEVLGEEPSFTNYAQTRNAPVFIGTLDYIFVSPEISALSVRDLPAQEAAKGPYPTDAEPSDHAMIAATLRIPAKLEEE